MPEAAPRINAEMREAMQPKHALKGAALVLPTALFSLRRLYGKAVPPATKWTRLQVLMALPHNLHQAVRSLTSALDLLEAAVERRAQADAARADREQELALMQEDRARLGEDLERAEQLNAGLQAAGATTMARLGRMEAICTTLQRRAAD